MARIKAKTTFAAGNVIFYPYAIEPYEVDDDQAQNWAQAGYCEILDAEDINTPEQTETPENEPLNVDYDAMEYNDLKEAGKVAGIKGYNTMKKKDLIKALKGE